MSIAILLITHENTGSSLLRVLKNTCGQITGKIGNINIKPKNDPKEYTNKITATINKLNKTHEGVLILTDLYGSTPYNIVYRIKKTLKSKIEIVTGVNLPMLIKIITYINLPLKELAHKAMQGGKQGIIK